MADHLFAEPVLPILATRLSAPADIRDAGGLNR
jgi:hypothetical protein